MTGQTVRKKPGNNEMKTFRTQERKNKLTIYSKMKEKARHGIQLTLSQHDEPC